jgi:hypothetical protein
MPNPWVSLRRDQLITVNKAVKEKEQLEKGLEEEVKKKINRSLFSAIITCHCALLKVFINFSSMAIKQKHFFQHKNSTHAPVHIFL